MSADAPMPNIFRVERVGDPTFIDCVSLVQPPQALRIITQQQALSLCAWLKVKANITDRELLAEVRLVEKAQ